MPRSLARVLAALLLLVVGALGCTGPVHKAGSDLLTNHYYFKDGYRIEGPYGTWIHKAGSNEDMLKIGLGYEEKDFTDQDRDGKVDMIDINERRFIRADKGAEQLFADADAELARYRVWMHVHEIHTRWQAMSATDLARAAGYQH